MGKKPPAEKAKKYGLTYTETNILFWVTVWFNGTTWKIHGSKAYIGSAYEPTLRVLCFKNWEPDFDQAHEQLIERGLFKSERRDDNIHVAGRRCRWLPTENCMQIIEDIFSDDEQLYPDWATEDHTRPPTFRDGSELLQHRKGVLASAYLFSQLERVTSLLRYPRNKVPQRPDIYLYRNDEQLARVEVLGPHRNTDMWEDKFTQWRGRRAGPTIWIYPNRTTMTQFWNHLITQGLIGLDNGRFGGNPNNWSAKRVNARLQRSRKGPPDYTSHDVVWTLGGVVGGGRVDAFKLFKHNNIILRS